jgi:LPXTG-motif cell wall-anchored protein
LADTGAIAGGVVGGVLGLLAILALLWFFLIKRRKSKQHAFDEKTASPPTLRKEKRD